MAEYGEWNRKGATLTPNIGLQPPEDGAVERTLQTTVGDGPAIVGETVRQAAAGRGGKHPLARAMRPPVRAQPRQDTYEHRTVSANTRGLLDLGHWLTAHGCTHVAMEATDVYWKPVWHVLENEFALILANSMLTAAYYMLRDGVEYHDLGSQHFAHRDKDQMTKRLLQRLRDLGVVVEVKAA